MAVNRILYLDFYLKFIEDVYTPAHKLGLYLFMYQFYKHGGTVNCTGRVSIFDSYCPRCGQELNSGYSGTYTFLKGRKCEVGSSSTTLIADFIARQSGTTLQNHINTIYANEGWPLEPHYEGVYLDTTYGVNGVVYPANAMTLLPEDNILLQWKLINNSDVDILVKHELQIRAHKFAQAWHGKGDSDPPTIETATVPALSNVIIQSNREVPSDWQGPHGIDWKIIDATGHILYNGELVYDGTPFKLYLTTAP